MTTHRHALRAALAATLTIGAIAPAAASAHFDNNRVYFPHPGQSPAAAIARVQPGGDFNWSDAAIGAAAGLGASVIGLAGTRRWVRRGPGSKAAMG